MAQSALERIKALETERTKLLSEARREALERAEEAVATLNQLGFTFRLVEGEEPTKRATGGRKGTRQVDPNRPCPTCGFRTDPPHDARSHRKVAKGRPFTDDELRERGMTKVNGAPAEPASEAAE